MVALHRNLGGENDRGLSRMYAELTPGCSPSGERDIDLGVSVWPPRIETSSPFLKSSTYTTAPNQSTDGHNRGSPKLDSHE